MLGLTTTSSLMSSRPFCSLRPRLLQPRSCAGHAAAAAAVHTGRPRTRLHTGGSSRTSRTSSSSSTSRSSSSALRALSSSSSSGGDDAADAATRPSRPVTKQQLTAQLEAAVAEERYGEAATLRDQLRALEEQDPAARAAAQLARLQEQLEAAVAAEDYAAAAALRDQVRAHEEAHRPQPPDLAGVPTSSDTVTEGIRVKVTSYYVPAQSRPELGQYFFAYKVVISNEGARTVMVNSRHWLITDGSGKMDHVRGPGIVGEQPILEPGRSFEYQSACPLFATHGVMEGEYEVVLLDESGEWDGTLEVKIGRFALRKPELA